MSGDWRCECDLGWDGADCATRLETQCGDGVDNDGGEIIIINNTSQLWPMLGKSLHQLD